VIRYSLRGSAVLWILIAVNVLVFIFTTVNPSSLNYLALTKPITAPYYWTFLTAMFVHANILHILTNMLTLYFFGVFCLRLIRADRFLAVYFVGGLAGNLLFFLIGPNNSAAVGASGAIFAIGGVLLAMRPTQRVYMYFLIPMPLWLAIIAGFLLTFFASGVAWQAHLGGLIVGALAGLFFRHQEIRRFRSPW